jgi:hypothetical protein
MLALAPVCRAAEAELSFWKLPKGWKARPAGVRVLSARGDRAQAIQFTRRGPSSEMALRAQANETWESYFTTQMRSGSSVFLDKASLESGHVDGFLLCQGRRYTIKGTVVEKETLLAIVAGLRCGAVYAKPVTGSPVDPAAAAAGSTAPRVKTAGGALPVSPDRVVKTVPPAQAAAARPRGFPRALRSYAAADILAEPSGEHLIGRTRDEVMKERPYLQPRHHWNIGPMRIEELREFVEGPIVGTRNYVFEGWGEPRLVRVIFELKDPPPGLAGRITAATVRASGEPSLEEKPYALKADGVDDGVLARVKRLGTDLESYAKKEKKGVDPAAIKALLMPPKEKAKVWAAGEHPVWMTDAELGIGRPGLRSLDFIRNSYHLFMLFGVATLLAWVALYWTPLYDGMPKILQKAAGAVMGFASSFFWVLYPLASAGWFFFELYKYGYL